MATIADVSDGQVIATVWGDSVKDELNRYCVKVNGHIGDGLLVPQWMTGPLIINASPALRLRRSNEAPYLQFEHSGGATIFGTIQGTGTQMNYVSTPTGGVHRFVVGTTQRLQVDNAGIDVAGILDVSGAAHVHGLTYAEAGIRAGGAGGSQLQIVDSGTSAGDTHDAYLSFYGAATNITTIGTRTGYIGFPGTATMTIRNEVANGAMSLVALAGIGLTAGTTIAFSAGGVTQGLMQAGDFMWGKAASDLANAGIEMLGAGSANEGGIYSTVDKAGARNLYLRRNGAASAQGQKFIEFWDGSAITAYVEQDKTAPVGVHGVNFAATAPSDYRLKDDLGAVDSPTDRLLALQPKHLAWKETGAEFDGFLAHEVAEVSPHAVRGEKDAVYAEGEVEGIEAGTIKIQQLDAAALVPLLTAALQEALLRVTDLEERLAALEAS